MKIRCDLAANLAAYAMSLNAVEPQGSISDRAIDKITGLLERLLSNIGAKSYQCFPLSRI